MAYAEGGDGESGFFSAAARAQIMQCIYIATGGAAIILWFAFLSACGQLGDLVRLQRDQKRRSGVCRYPFLLKLDKLKNTIALFGAILAITGGHWAYNIKERSYYDVLNIGVHERSPTAIRKAYKRLSVELHPDRNPSPTAHDDFLLVRDAHSVIRNEEKRDEYNRYGRNENESAKNAKIAADFAWIVLWFLLSFAFTSSASVRGARVYATTTLVVFFIAEMSFKYANWLDLTAFGAAFLPKMTGDDKLQLLRFLWPSAFGGMLFRAAQTFYDKAGYDKEMIQKMWQQSSSMLSMLHNKQSYGRILRESGLNGPVGDAGEEETKASGEESDFEFVERPVKMDEIVGLVSQDMKNPVLSALLEKPLETGMSQNPFADEKIDDATPAEKKKKNAKSGFAVSSTRNLPRNVRRRKKGK